MEAVEDLMFMSRGTDLIDERVPYFVMPRSLTLMTKDKMFVYGNSQTHFCEVIIARSPSDPYCFVLHTPGYLHPTISLFRNILPNLRFEVTVESVEL